MLITKLLCGGAALAALALGLALVPMQAAPYSSLSTQEPNSNEEPVPAYHHSAPTGHLPQTLSPDLFPDPVAQNAYRLAARIKSILYQEPCYCHCDRSQGHGSLLDCFAGQHAAVCGVCEREAFYSYEQSHKSKSASQIRAGIMRGDWQRMDVTKYESPLPAK